MKDKINLQVTDIEGAYVVDCVNFMINHLKSLQIISNDKKENNAYKNLIFLGEQFNKKLHKKIKEKKSS